MPRPPRTFSIDEARQAGINALGELVVKLRAKLRKDGLSVQEQETLFTAVDKLESIRKSREAAQ